MQQVLKLSQLLPGQCATVVKINIYTSLRRRLSDLGLACGSRVECVMKSPVGNPTAYRIRGALIAIRNEDANKIECQIKSSR